MCVREKFYVCKKKTEGKRETLDSTEVFIVVVLF